MGCKSPAATTPFGNVAYAASKWNTDPIPDDHTVTWSVGRTIKAPAGHMHRVDGPVSDVVLYVNRRSGHSCGLKMRSAAIVHATRHFGKVRTGPMPKDVSDQNVGRSLAQPYASNQ